MRISDWSSDVCSSDLGGVRPEFRVDGPDLATFETHLQLEFFGDAGQGRFKPTERAPVARNQQVRGQPVADLRDPAILDLATALADRLEQLQRDRKSTRLNSSH